MSSGSTSHTKHLLLIWFQVWYGTGSAFIICFIIGCGVIGAFYGLGKNVWSGTENIWEGVFALLASIIISIMGAALLRISKLQDKWRVKLAKALEKRDSVKDTEGSKSKFKLWCEKYAMFVLPFITVLREGLEAVVFTGGVSLGYPASAFPLPVITGVLAGSAIGFMIYKYANQTLLLMVELMQVQRWKTWLSANLDDCFDVLPVPCGRQPFFKGCLDVRDR